jgi:hypothetical protein
MAPAVMKSDRLTHEHLSAGGSWWPLLRSHLSSRGVVAIMDIVAKKTARTETRRENWGRKRAQIRTELTPGERRFFYGYTLLSVLSPSLGILLAIFGSGTTRIVGIAILGVALLTMAIPISPFLRARISRRSKESAGS